MKMTRVFTILLLGIAFMMPGLATATVDISPGYSDYQMTPTDALTPTAILNPGGDSEQLFKAGQPVDLAMSNSDVNPERPQAGLADPRVDMRSSEAAAGVTRRHWYIDH